MKTKTLRFDKRNETSKSTYLEQQKTFNRSVLPYCLLCMRAIAMKDTRLISNSSENFGSTNLIDARNP